MTLIEERERESLTVKSDDMTVCGVSIFGCCLNTSNFVLVQSIENQVEIGTTAKIVQIDIVDLLLYQSRRSCLVLSMHHGYHAATRCRFVVKAMARVQLAVIAQHWSASGPIELFVVVVKDSITMVGWCCSFV